MMNFLSFSLSGTLHISFNSERQLCLEEYSWLALSSISTLSISSHSLLACNISAEITADTLLVCWHMWKDYSSWVWGGGGVSAQVIGTPAATSIMLCEVQVFVEQLWSWGLEHGLSRVATALGYRVCTVLGEGGPAPRTG